jgi:translation initiation factor 2-alpha kinase 4
MAPDIEMVRTNTLTKYKGYYNTWTEEVPDVSETDDDTTATDVATTEDSVSEISPGAELNVEFGNSTGGLDFMSSSGYPQIEYDHSRN